MGRAVSRPGETKHAAPLGRIRTKRRSYREAVPTFQGYSHLPQVFWDGKIKKNMSLVSEEGEDQDNNGKKQ